MNEICIAERGKRTPVKLQPYVWGAKAFISLMPLDRSAPSTILVADPAALIIELRLLADQLEAQTCRETKQLLQQRQARATLDYSSITPQMVIEYFEQSPILRAYAADVKTVLKYAAEETSITSTQLQNDVALLKPRMAELIRADGSINKSAAARVLGVSAGGAGWERVSVAAEALIEKAA